jgi:hypothetical protein
MATTRGSIVIDARVNALRGAHGIARSVMKLAAHLGQAGDGLGLRVLVNAGRPQLFRCPRSRRTPTSSTPPFRWALRIAARSSPG